MYPGMYAFCHALRSKPPASLFGETDPKTTSVAGKEDCAANTFKRNFRSGLGCRTTAAADFTLAGEPVNAANESFPHDSNGR